MAQIRNYSLQVYNLKMLNPNIFEGLLTSISRIDRPQPARQALMPLPVRREVYAQPACPAPMPQPARQARPGVTTGGTPKAGCTVTPAPARRRQAPQNYAHLPSPHHAHQRLLDSPVLNHLCHYLPYICLVPRSVPCFSINCHLSWFTHVLMLVLFCYLSVPE